MKEKKDIISDSKRSYTPVRLNANFPVSDLDYTTRNDAFFEYHLHDCFEIGICRKGSGIFLIEEKILSFNEGDAVIINHHEFHTMQSSPGQTVDWNFINLSPELLLSGILGSESTILDTNLFSGSNFINIFTNISHPIICSYVKCIIDELLLKKNFYQFSVKALVLALLIELHRIVAIHQKSVSPSRSISYKKLREVAPAIEFISQNFHNSISLDKLASLCDYSTSNFRKVFKDATELSPIDYIKKIRMTTATAMLHHTSTDICDIALQCGFPTLSNFNRQFRSYYDKSPRELRNQ